MSAKSFSLPCSVLVSEALLAGVGSLDHACARLDRCRRGERGSRRRHLSRRRDARNGGGRGGGLGRGEVSRARQTACPVSTRMDKPGPGSESGPEPVGVERAPSRFAEDKQGSGGGGTCRRPALVAFFKCWRRDLPRDTEQVTALVSRGHARRDSGFKCWRRDLPGRAVTAEGGAAACLPGDSASRSPLHPPSHGPHHEPSHGPHHEPSHGPHHEPSHGRNRSLVSRCASWPRGPAAPAGPCCPAALSPP